MVSLSNHEVERVEGTTVRQKANRLFTTDLCEPGHHVYVALAQQKEDDMSHSTRWMILAAFITACLLIYFFL